MKTYNFLKRKVDGCVLTEQIPYVKRRSATRTTTTYQKPQVCITASSLIRGNFCSEYPEPSTCLSLTWSGPHIPAHHD